MTVRNVNYQWVSSVTKIVTCGVMLFRTDYVDANGQVKEEEEEEEEEEEQQQQQRQEQQRQQQRQQQQQQQQQQ
ncbi:hypothetical protein E2C01_053325 [Portunus trituberculatus]|uniref:Uncharacterized protein n=1 Tax=Portunus trituberculatus TaxID=210409 RepID=A0A5B7GNX3_PORTR|nr:hypothetical protein [Portunus trituberculatus]